MPFVARNIFGESHSDTDLSSVLKQSVQAWSQFRISDTSKLVHHVKTYFSLLEKEGHSFALEALCNPLYIVRFNGQMRLVASVRGHHHLLPCSQENLLETDLQNPGYSEEDVLVHFIKMTYTHRWTEMIRDVEIAHRSMIALGRFSHGITFLHNRVVKTAMMPPFLLLIIHLPMLPEITKLILDMVLAVRITSSSQQVGAVVYQLTKPIAIECEDEWAMVETCKRCCEVTWQCQYHREVQVKFGKLSWSMENNMTFVLYGGKKYRERWEQRIAWVALWFHCILVGKFSISQSPRMLLLRLASLLSCH